MRRRLRLRRRTACRAASATRGDKDLWARRARRVPVGLLPSIAAIAARCNLKEVTLTLRCSDLDRLLDALQQAGLQAEAEALEPAHPPASSLTLRRPVRRLAGRRLAGRSTRPPPA